MTAVELEEHFNLYVKHPIYSRCIKAYVEAYCQKKNLSLRLNKDESSRVEIRSSEQLPRGNPLESKETFRAFLENINSHFL